MTSPEPVRIDPGQPQRRQLAEGEVHSYLVRLEAGEYVRMIAEQHGVDLVLRLFAPGETQPIVEVDNPTCTWGLGWVSEIAPVAGDYRVDVVGGEGAPTGQYELRIEGHRVATKADHKRVEGERVFLEGERLRRADELDEAIARYERALGFWREAGDLGRQAKALYSIGCLRERLDQWEESVKLCTEAVELYRQAGDPRGQAQALNQSGRLLTRLSRSEEARPLLENAVLLFHMASNLDGAASALSNLGKIHNLAGRFQEAIEVFENALSMWRQLGDRLGPSTAHYGIAQALFQLEDLDGARREIEASLALADHQRAATKGLDLQAFYFATQQRYWELYINIFRELDRLHPNQGFAARALEAEEGRRARSLLDALAGTSAEAKASKTLSLAEIQGRLLDTDTLLLVYSLGEEHSVLWKITRSTLTSYQLTRREQIETAAEFAHEALSHRLRQDSSLRRKAVDGLAKLILAPVAKDLPKFRRLLIVADGALHRIPFGALPDLGAAPAKDRPPLLVQGHTIVYLPSASVGASLRQERRAGPLDQRSGPLIAILADPVFDTSDPRVDQSCSTSSSQSDSTRGSLAHALRDLGITRLERLPFSREEALAIQELSHRSGDVVSVLDFAANRQVLNDQRWRRAPILHFATHGLLDDRQPELSGLVLSLVNPDGSLRPDGFLRLREIYDLDLDADLVVLSACQTGSGKELRGEGLLGLARGFMSIGVPQLVFSLWKVEEEGATKELMRLFYKEIFNGYRPPEAMQRAQKTMLQQEAWSDPSLWAGFIFVGDFERQPGGGIEVRDTGGSDALPRHADNAGLPPPKIKPKPPKR